MCHKHSKFQLVGSLLRPRDLLVYKEEIRQRDDIQYPFYDAFEGYQAAEEAAIDRVIQEQVNHGIDILTDGEYSKSTWHLDFLWGFDGIQRHLTDHGYPFKDHDGQPFETRKDIGLKITGPLSSKNHHFLDLFKKLQTKVGDQETKITLFGPAHAFTELLVFNGQAGPDQYYKTKAELRQGLVAAYKEFLDQYHEIGGKIVQFDDCLWELFDPSQPTPLADNQEDLLALADEFIAINNEIADYGKSLGLKVWTHNCRGNYSSRYAGEGTYEAIAEKFLAQQHYDRFFLEWDDDRAGDISALAALKDRPDVEVVLGLLSSKTSSLDDRNRVLNLLEKASQYIPKDRLYLSHQCGFASCDEGNELTLDQQWAKIDQGQEIAKEFFG